MVSASLYFHFTMFDLQPTNPVLSLFRHFQCNHRISDHGPPSSDGMDLSCCGTDRRWWVHALSLSAGGFLSSGVTECTNKPDWRYIIHTPTQNVTTTPSTDNTTPHHKQTTTHPLTNNNYQRTKTSLYFGIRNKIEELKNSYTAPNRISSQYKKQNTHRQLNHQKYTTIRTDRAHKQGGGLITLIKYDITFTFTNINIPKAINTHNT